MQGYPLEKAWALGAEKTGTISVTLIYLICNNNNNKCNTNKLDNLQETDKFLETHNLPRLNHEETENLNKLITSKVIDSVNKSHPTNKSPGADGCTGEFY